MDEKRRNAYHEAGHVVAAHCLGIPLDYVTIVRDSGETHDRLGWTQPKDREVDRSDKEIADNYAIYALAGLAAWDRLNFDSASSFAGTLDILKADEFILKSSYLFSEDERQAHIDVLNKKAEEMISTAENWKKVELVAKALMEKGTLNEDEIRCLLK